MIKISDQFYNSKKLLRKEAKTREDGIFKEDEVLENDVWLLFFKLGFEFLNIGRECTVYFGREDNKLASKKVDVVAESEEVRVYIECTTQKNHTPKIKQWISEVEGIRKFDDKSKNISFVYCADTLLGESDKKLLESKGIINLHPEILKYFRDFREEHNTLAYYQMISLLCKGQTIRSKDDSDLTIPCIRCKYGSSEYSYLFGIQPSKLIPLATVPHRKLDHGDNLNQNYQRFIKKRKISQINKFR